MTNPLPSAPARSTRLLWGLVAGLLLLNVVLTCCLWLGTRGQPQAAPPATGEAFLADTLQLTARQRQRYDTLRARYFRQVQPLAQNCRRSCQHYFSLLDSTLTDEQLATRSRAALASKVAVDVLTVRHLQQVAGLCTPPQRQLLGQLLTQTPGEGCAVPGGNGSDCLMPLGR